MARGRRSDGAGPYTMSVGPYQMVVGGPRPAEDAPPADYAPTAEGWRLPEGETFTAVSRATGAVLSGSMLDEAERVIDELGIRGPRRDAAYSVLCDLSGSLSPHRAAMAEAVGACSAIAAEMLGAHEIVGFDLSAEKIRHHGLKGFHETEPSGLPAIADPSFAGGGTPAASALAFASARLRGHNRRERHIVLMVDGATNDDDAARQRIAAARAAGTKVSIIGLAFAAWAEADLRKAFPDEDILLASDPDQVPTLFGRVIRRMSALHP